jgi:hypothetical protein
MKLFTHLAVIAAMTLSTSLLAQDTMPSLIGGVIKSIDISARTLQVNEVTIEFAVLDQLVEDQNLFEGKKVVIAASRKNDNVFIGERIYPVDINSKLPKK